MAQRLILACGLATMTMARPLSDAEQVALYGFKYAEGPTRPLTVSAGVGAPDTLRGAADAAGVFMGTAANYAGMSSNTDTQYRAIALGEFNLATAENECKVRGCGTWLYWWHGAVAGGMRCFLSLNHAVRFLYHHPLLCSGRPKSPSGALSRSRSEYSSAIHSFTRMPIVYGG